MKPPMPSMSAAGLERVKVTQRKFRSFRAVNSLSSTITISGNARIGSSGPNDRQNAGDVADVVPVGRPLDRQDAGQHHARLAESVGKAQAGGQLAGQRPAHGPGGGDHDLRALVESVPGVVEGVDRRPGLEVQVVRQSTRPSRCAKNAGMSWMSRSGSSSRATISRYFASDSWPWPRMALATVRISCGRAHGGVGHVALAGDGQEQRMHAGGVDGVDGMHARDARSG